MRRAAIAVGALAVIFLGLLVYVVLYQRGEPRQKEQLFDFKDGQIGKIELTYANAGEGGGKETVVIQKEPEDNPVGKVAKKSALVAAWVGGVVLGIGIVVALVAAFAPPESERRGRTFRKVFVVSLLIALVAGGVVGLLVYLASDRVSKDYTWEILQPLRARGDKDTIDSFARDIAALAASTTFNRGEQKRLRQPDNLKEAGLNDPSLTVQVWNLRGHSLGELAVGKTMSIGSDVYARVNGSDFVTLGSWKVDGLKKKPGDLRDKSVAHLDPKDVTGLELRYANSSIVLKRTEKPTKSEFGEDHDWEIVKPIQAKGERYACDEVVNKIKDLKVDEFIEKGQEKPLPDYGLDKPAVTAVVELKGGKRETIYLSDKRDPDTLSRIYCRAEGRDEVFLVSSSTLDGLRKQPFDLRDKRVCDFASTDVTKLTVKYRNVTYVISRKSENDWDLEQPKRGRCNYGKVDDIRWYMHDLQANEFVADSPPASDLYKWGLDKPIAEVTAHLKGGGETTVLIGTHIANDAEMYVKRADQPAVLLASDTLLQHLPENPDSILETPKPEPETPAGPAAH
jgi:hypothetical protein